MEVEFLMNNQRGKSRNPLREIPGRAVRFQSRRGCASKKFEIHFDCREHVDRLAIFHSRLEAPLKDGSRRFLVEPVTASADEVETPGIALWINNNPEQHLWEEDGAARGAACCCSARFRGDW
jgi:hypothetical protein